MATRIIEALTMTYPAMAPGGGDVPPEGGDSPSGEPTEPQAFFEADQGGPLRKEGDEDERRARRERGEEEPPAEYEEGQQPQPQLQEKGLAARKRAEAGRPKAKGDEDNGKLDYSTMTAAQLKEHARDRGVALESHDTKADIIAKLEAADNE
jgi:hypothetical protein